MLLLRLARSLFGADKLVILDSGLFVLKYIVSLKKRGIYASSGPNILMGMVFKPS